MCWHTEQCSLQTSRCCFSFCCDFCFLSLPGTNPRAKLKTIRVSSDQHWIAVTGCSKGAYVCMWVRDYWLLMYLHLNKCDRETCCRPQRHFQSYKSESYHSSLNGTAVCTQISSHLKPRNIICVSKQDVQPEVLQTLQMKQFGFLSMFQEKEVPLTSWLLLWICVY